LGTSQSGETGFGLAIDVAESADGGARFEVTGVEVVTDGAIDADADADRDDDERPPLQ
jgi:hypothetical protein